MNRISAFAGMVMHLRGVVNLLSIHAQCQSWGRDTSAPNRRYTNPRFPVELISPAVGLDFRFCLSCREVEELLLERGGVVTYEAMRKWRRQCGQR